MNIYHTVRSEVIKALTVLQAEGFLPADASFAAVDAMPTKDPAHGDIATNAAMVLAGKVGKKPRGDCRAVGGGIKEIVIPRLDRGIS